MLKIIEALPEIFDRTYTVLEPETTVHLAFCLFSFHGMDALPVGFGTSAGKKKLVISGYSCLSKLLQSDPQEYKRFLDQPSEAVSVELATISGDSDLADLFSLFDKTRLGFAWVEDTSGSKIGGFASMRDLLGLYGKSVIRANLTAREVESSPVLSLPGDTTLKQALEKMIKSRVRRVLISETQRIVSDRQIIDYVFCISKLGETSRKPSALLDANLGDLESILPERVSPDAKVNEIAGKLFANSTKGDCLICEKGLVTPWDMIIKPWRRGKLVFKEPRAEPVRREILRAAAG
jgi:CBS domain-containing protein